MITRVACGGVVSAGKVGGLLVLCWSLLLGQEREVSAEEWSQTVPLQVFFLRQEAKLHEESNLRELITGMDYPWHEAAHTRRLTLVVVGGLWLFYKSYVSPLLSRRCIYKPSCSQFMVVAVAREGLLGGLILTADRLTRCNLWVALKYPLYDPFLGERADVPLELRVGGRVPRR